MEQKVNYQRVMEKEIEIIKALKEKPRLLLHVCCAPCSSYVFEYLSDYFDITAHFYNPNIDIEDEFRMRKDELDKLVEYLCEKSIKVLSEEYHHEEYLQAIKGFEAEKEGGNRCGICIEQRMEHSAKVAKEKNFDYFTTTLSISPHKNAQLINNIGKRLSESYGVLFLHSDFKKKNGYKRSIELSKEFNLYRQDYCGCEFSKRI